MKVAPTCLVLLLSVSLTLAAPPPTDPFAWPAQSRETKPWAYWWWMGSAVDKANITKELQRYHDAGLGGVHIIPIYGAKGYEKQFIDYLSPKWMEMMGHSVSEATRLGMGVDMTTGSGWCFGGPEVTDLEANAIPVVKTFDVAAGARLTAKLDPKETQTVMAFPAAEGQPVDLTAKLQADGQIDWAPTDGAWKIYAISQKPSGQKVKRAAPGGTGPMLNLFSPPAMQNYLRWFEKGFANYTGPKPRSMYHDSYEYKSDWSPELFAEFEKRRGYRLQDELPALFGPESGDRTARVKSDYRETISDIMAEVTLPAWVKWSHDHGFITRNEAHGSPGNLLDLYAVADLGETEMFHADRDPLVSKLASSADHVAGHNLTSSETGTWLEEHFTEKLGDMKGLLDELFCTGVNHVFFHGTCYSPDEAAWPGWLFYASTEMNPRNAIWHDLPGLAAYISRCQAVLQTGTPDNDVLLYWPIYDTWNDPTGMTKPFTVHARDWLEGMPVGKAAKRLWSRGYNFDYISDRGLAGAKGIPAGIQTPGGKYRVVVVPKCEHLPLDTLQNLLALAEAGATIIFEGNELPKDVPGWGNLEKRRTRFKDALAGVVYENFSVKETVLARLKLTDSGVGDVAIAKIGKGRALLGDLEAALALTVVERETLADQPGLIYIRRAVDRGRYYFISNRGTAPSAASIPLAFEAGSVVIMDPLSGRTGWARLDPVARDGRVAPLFTNVHLQLQPGESVILHAIPPYVQMFGMPKEDRKGPLWAYSEPAGQPAALSGTWKVKFIEGGPELPQPFEAAKLASWTELAGAAGQSFAGTAVYSLTFDSPAATTARWQLDLGKVMQSARVRLNGRDLGTLLMAPYRITLDELKRTGNVLELEVTSTSANRIRDLDLRKVQWQNFYDINFVNLDYKHFDASTWPLTEAGLLGPVTLTPLLTNPGQAQ